MTIGARWRGADSFHDLQRRCHWAVGLRSPAVPFTADMPAESLGWLNPNLACILDPESESKQGVSQKKAL